MNPQKSGQIGSHHEEAKRGRPACRNAPVGNKIRIKVFKIGWAELTEAHCRSRFRDEIVSLDLCKMLINSNQCRRCLCRKVFKLSSSGGTSSVIITMWSIQKEHAYDISSEMSRFASLVESDMSHILCFKTSSRRRRHALPKCWFPDDLSTNQMSLPHRSRLVRKSANVGCKISTLALIDSTERKHDIA
jgi:hypothetical protein